MTLPRTPSFRLDGRRALVTGAGRGIGLAAASALAEHGAHVTLCARTRDEIEEVAAEIRGHGFSADCLALDVTKLSAFADAVAATAPYDVFVNNAGTNRPNPFTEVTVEDFDLVMGLNVRAAFFAAQAVTRGLLAAKSPGSIINISSQMGHVGAANRSLYCASKWAIEGFSRAMAIELAPHGIRVNTLCPTFIETPMTKPFFENAEFRKGVLSKIKLGRLGKVEDLMGAILFLASDASALMTGSSLMVDGGWWMAAGRQNSARFDNRTLRQEDLSNARPEVSRPAGYPGANGVCALVISYFSCPSNTARQSALRRGLLRTRQLVIADGFGMKSLQSLNTSGSQARRCAAVSPSA